MGGGVSRRFRWDLAKKRLVDPERVTSLDRRADAILGQETRDATRVLEKTRKRVSRAPRHDGGSRDVWIVVGGDRTASGEREVHNFRTLREAHAAGFTWAV